MKNMFIYQIKVFKEDNSYDLEFEKRVLNLIYSCTEYSNFPYNNKEKATIYKILNNPERQNNYYSSIIKKETHLTTTQLDDETEKVSTSKVNTDNFTRFTLDLNSNLIAISRKGNFGPDQFTQAFKYIFGNAIRKEFNESIGIIQISSAPGIPKSWENQNIMEKIKKLDYLKEIEMKFSLTVNPNSDETTENKIIEKREIRGSTIFSTNSIQITQLEKAYNFYNSEKYGTIEFNCKDIHNQTYIIDDIEVLSYSYNSDITEKEEFIIKSKDTIEDYIINYLNK